MQGFVVCWSHKIGCVWKHVFLKFSHIYHKGENHEKWTGIVCADIINFYSCDQSNVRTWTPLGQDCYLIYNKNALQNNVYIQNDLQ